MRLVSTLGASLGAALSLGLSLVPAHAAATVYPLTLENCGAEVTFEKAPERAVGLGQNSVEIMLLLGLEDKVVASAFWPSKVLPELEEANAKVKLLTVEQPSLEAILGEHPDFVAAQLPLLLGPDSKVAKREDFSNLGIPSYLSPGVCNTRLDTGDVYGSRATLWNTDLVYQEIDELSQIFDVADRGQALINQFREREAALRARVGSDNKDLGFVFWFSSPTAEGDANLAGKNGATGFIADLLGGHNVIDTEAEWPTASWEAIMATNPDVIVAADLDRNRWDLDKIAAKLEFLNTDPAVSQLPAVKSGHIVIMNGQSMNPTIRTIYGAEQVADQLAELGLID